MRLNRGTFWIVIVIALLVVLVRLAVFVAYPQNGPQVERGLAPDQWLDIAREVVAGQGYVVPGYPDEPTAKRGPTVVLFFAAVLWLAGDHLWSIVLAQWLVDVGTGILVFFMALEIFQDRRVALLAAVLFAFYVPGFVFTFTAWSEPLFTLVLAGFSLSVLRALRQPSAGRFAISGILLGLAVLARPVMQFYPLAVLPLAWWAMGKSWSRAMPRFAVFCMGFAIVLLPWVARNYLVFHAFIAGSGHSGDSFYQGNAALPRQDYLRYRSTEEAMLILRQTLETRWGPAPKHLSAKGYARAKGMDEYEFDRLAFDETIKLIRAFPERYFVASLVRVIRFWFGVRFLNLFSGIRSPWAYQVPAVNGVLLILAIIAVVWFRGAWLRSAIPIFVLIAYTTAIYAATLAIARYSVPIIPYVIIFSALSIFYLLPKLGKAGTMVLALLASCDQSARPLATQPTDSSVS
jgi:4-amino-4-deoxy-L-arabinose transferase-like glycosyltransferase